MTAIHLTQSGLINALTVRNEALDFLESLAPRIRGNFHRLIGRVPGDTFEAMKKRTEARYQRELKKRDGSWADQSKPHGSYSHSVQVLLRELVDCFEAHEEAA